MLLSFIQMFLLILMVRVCTLIWHSRGLPKKNLSGCLLIYLISLISAAPTSTCWLDGFKQKEVHRQEICSKWSTDCCYCLLQYIRLRFHFKKEKKKQNKTVWYFQITSYLEVESGYVATRPLVAGANTVCRELWEARSAGIELDPLPVFQCFSLS